MKMLLAAVAAVVFAATIFAQVKTPKAPGVQHSYTSSLQMVVVTTSGIEATTGTASLFERVKAGSDWKQTGENFPVVIGKNGLAWSTDAKPYGMGTPNPENHFTPKKEGDGKSPAGMFPLTAAFGKAMKPEFVDMPYIKLDEFTECVDDPKSSFYNTIANRMKVGNFDWKSSEKMLAEGPEYFLGLFVAYNTFPVVKGSGSCIYLHVWKDAGTGTLGSTAMERRSMERIVGWVSPDKYPYLALFPKDYYEKNYKKWKLPKIK